MPNRKDNPDDWHDFYDPYASGEMGEDEHVEIPPISETDGSSRAGTVAAVAMGLLAAGITVGAVRARRRKQDKEKD
jgi:hypothetical protein